MAQANQTDTAAEQARDHMLRLLIAEQNDAFRRCLGFAALWRDHHLKGRAVVTPGFDALPMATKSALMEKVINFTDFTEENDPWEIIPLVAWRPMVRRFSGRSTSTTPPTPTARRCPIAPVTPTRRAVS